MSTAPTVATLEAILAAFNDHDLDRIMASSSTTASRCRADPTRGGRDAAAEKPCATAWRRGSPGCRTSSTARTAGDRGVSEWTLRGTTPQGERIEVRGCDLWTSRDGKVAKKDSYWKIRTPP